MGKIINRLFIFNPDCELAIANGSKFFMPSSNIVKMMEDLAFLPAWMAEEGDCVLVKETLSDAFQKDVIRPFQVNCRAILDSEISNISGICGEPWGLSPKMCHWMAQRGMGGEWQPEQKEWYSRKTARKGLEYLMNSFSFLEAGILPRICFSLEEMEYQLGEGQYIAKAPWSSSGKGLLPLEGHLEQKEREWLGGILRRQGYLMLEKRLNKIEDFAMEFCVGERGVEFVGWSLFTTGNNGEYRGNYIGSQEKLEKKLEEQLGKDKLSALRKEVPLMLEKLLPAYRGYLGVDMMVYNNASGIKCLHPCVEINLRYNMGIVALFLSRKIMLPGKVGEFTIRFFPSVGEALNEHRQLQQEFPLLYKNNRMESGYLNLTPVSETTRFVASIRCY